MLRKQIGVVLKSSHLIAYSGTGQITIHTQQNLKHTEKSGSKKCFYFLWDDCDSVIYF